MTTPLLSFPPELLVNVLSFLPIPALLKFSETSRYSHSLANASLHTLSLGIHPSRVSGLISNLAATQCPQPKKVGSSFSLLDPCAQAIWRTTEDPDAHVTNNGPYQVSVLIPDAQAFDYTTLVSFHTALTKSVLIRHGATLRNLELSLWTLTAPIAKALSTLSALRALSIRIEDFPHVRAVPRRLIASQRVEQRKAWDTLVKTAVWAPRLTALRIEGGDISTNQLRTLLQKSRWCRELWLCKCSLIGKEFWRFLGNEWEGRTALRILTIMRCGAHLDEEILNIIGSLRDLQVSRLYPNC